MIVKTDNIFIEFNINLIGSFCDFIRFFNYKNTQDGLYCNKLIHDYLKTAHSHFARW